VTQTTVSGLNPTLPLFSDAKSNLLPQGDRGTDPQSAVAHTTSDYTPGFPDTVSISSQSRQAVAGIKREDLTSEAVKIERAKKGEANTPVMSDKPELALSKIQFVYDQRGELSVRYMDASDRLIYQIPSELMLSLKEAALKAESAVDTKV
jgi:hypothetical protein